MESYQLASELNVPLIGEPDVLERDAAALTEGLQFGLALTTESSLGRPGRVVEPRVDDTAVVPRLVTGELGLLLEDRDPELGALLEEAVRRGQTNDPAADDGNINAFDHGLIVGNVRLSRGSGQ